GEPVWRAALSYGSNSRNRKRSHRRGHIPRCAHHRSGFRSRRIALWRFARRDNDLHRLPLEPARPHNYSMPPFRNSNKFYQKQNRFLAWEGHDFLVVPWGIETGPALTAAVCVMYSKPGDD